MIKFILIVLLSFVSLFGVSSQNIVIVDSNFKSNEMIKKWSLYEEENETLNFIDLIKKAKFDKPISIPTNFSANAKAVWLKTKIYNSSNIVLPIRIITKGIDSLTTLWMNNTKNVNLYITGKNIPISERFIASQYLVVPINLEPKQSTTIYVRIYNQAYHLSLPYLIISNPKEANLFIKKGEIWYNFYLGGLFVMMVFSFILYIFYREKLYLFYFFCLICSFTVAFIYNDFTYLFSDKLPTFIKNKNTFALSLCLINICYLLLAEQYLNVDIKKPTRLIAFSRYVIATLFFLFIGFTVLGKTLYYYRYYFYPLISINAVITYYHLFKSIQKKYSPSWFFLAATIPIIFISTIDITSDFNNFPIQTLHDFYYAATFIEMFCLAIGIVYRFRIERSSLQSLQRELFVAEIKAQDKERERIARDLHDRIGNTIFRVRVSLQDCSDIFLKMVEPKKMYDKNISDLVKVYGEVQGLSRQLMPQNLVESDLLEEIRLQYGYTKNPNFKLSLPEKPLNLGVYFERTVYKIISEAVLNILKHAKATEVGIEISKDDKIFRLRIEDNGIGFDLNHLKKDGIGLNNLRFRAETELNGKISIESSPGNGTIILLKIKLKDIPTPHN